MKRIQELHSRICIVLSYQVLIDTLHGSGILPSTPVCKWEGEMLHETHNGYSELQPHPPVYRLSAMCVPLYTACKDFHKCLEYKMTYLPCSISISFATGPYSEQHGFPSYPPMLSVQHHWNAL